MNDRLGEWPEFDGPTISARKLPPGQEPFMPAKEAARHMQAAFVTGIWVGAILMALGFLAAFLTFRWL